MATGSENKRQGITTEKIPDITDNRIERPISDKPCHKLIAAAKDMVLKMLAEKTSYQNITKELEWRFRVSLSIAGISYYASHYRSEIVDRQIKWVDQDILQYPISHKEFRLRELSKLFNKAEDDKTAVMILRAVKAEIGEDVEKIAAALRSNTRGDNIVNIGIVKDERDAVRINKESAIAGSSKTGALDRFKMA